MVKSRLCTANLKTSYPDLGGIVDCCNLGGQALLQRDYGQAQDCTLTCLAFLFGEKFYPDIERIALAMGYDGEKRGTNPLTVRTIMQRVMRLAGVAGSAKSAYGKGVGWTWGRVKQLLQGGHYLILNLWRDGRGYYGNHSVTVVGYAEYRANRFLLVYDNWSRGVSYIDYDKLSVISSINWYE